MILLLGYNPNQDVKCLTVGHRVISKPTSLMTFIRVYPSIPSIRADGFEPLRFMPKDKTVVLGLISSKEPALESQDLLRRRIDEAAQYVPMENLAISPQCGFASTAPGNMLTMDQQARKLELVVETARKVWG